ncbi:aldo/keto reductase [Pokkaliibacter sp. CJK22405]|uniref:aldo/keto reductase n=1 Tax=Pokkaliibacter sp. CJK22405 TaxID=3384615 RepID=UPI003984EF7C
MKTLTSQGLTIPRLGFGTWRLKGEECQQAVETALELGYRHLDTAEMYDNEEGVGAGIKASGMAREEFHLTTKVWHDHLTAPAIRRALDNSLSKLQTDYVDLYMVHWPNPEMDMEKVFTTLKYLKEEERIRGIGVCNFPVPLLKTVVEELEVPLVCNQIEYHVLLDQSPVRNYLSQFNIPVTAYCPLAQGRLAEHEVLSDIAKEQNASAAQIALAWLLCQDGVMAIPKSSRREGIAANFAAQHIELTADQMARLNQLPKNQRLVNPDFGPQWDN